MLSKNMSIKTDANGDKLKTCFNKLCHSVPRLIQMQNKNACYV